MARHVIVISEDAMVTEDLETLKELPVFGSLWDKMSIIEKVRSIYPTVTYPCHATMMTGCYPDRHGITNNELNNLTELSSPWNWFYEKIRTPSIFDFAKKRGLSTSAVFWPVTGNCKSIDYLIDEYWPQDGEDIEQCFYNSGSSRQVVEKCIRPHEWMQVHRIHPYCDEFATACACSIIRRFKPNLLMLHTANIDAYRHQTGVFTDKVKHGLHEIDNWLGWIIKAVQDAGMIDETNFFIVSDHGQINIDRVLCPNVIFAREGLIDVNEDGTISDYRAIVKSAGSSAQVFLKNPSDTVAYQKAYRLLQDMCQEGIYGIGRVYTAEEAAVEHLRGEFSFVIETDGYTSFAGNWQGPVVHEFDTSDYRLGNATHGHHPDLGPWPTLMAFGPDIKEGAVIKRGRLVDEAPTFAAALGIGMENTDGHVISELMK